MTLCTRGLGSKNLIPTAGMGAYGAVVAVEEETRGGSSGKKVFKKITEVVGYDVLPRLFDEKEKLITPAQVIKALPKAAVTAKVKVIKHELGIKAPEARELIKKRIIKQIEAMRLYRLEQLNEQAINLILIAIADDD